MSPLPCLQLPLSAAYRPDYPDQVYTAVLQFAALPHLGTALDVATGSGQVAAALADRFDQVWACDRQAAGATLGRGGHGRGGHQRPGGYRGRRAHTTGCWLARLLLPARGAALSTCMHMRLAPPHCCSTQAQLDRAVQRPNLRYFRAAAEALEDLAGGTVDLLTAAQGLHWFDGPAFYAEARRVLQPGGTLAIWGERAKG